MNMSIQNKGNLKLLKKTHQGQVKGFKLKKDIELSIINDKEITDSFSVGLFDFETDKWDMKFISEEEYNFLVYLLGVTEEE